MNFMVNEFSGEIPYQHADSGRLHEIGAMIIIWKNINDKCMRHDTQYVKRRNKIKVRASRLLDVYDVLCEHKANW